MDRLMNYSEHLMFRRSSPGVMSTAASNHGGTLAILQRATVIALIALSLDASSATASDAVLADAAERNAYAAVQTLIAGKADVNAPQADGMTALHWSVYHDETRLTSALIKAGADVRTQNRYGVTPLSIACTNGNGDIVKLLLTAGADSNATLDGGETALMTASRTGRLRPVQLLLEHGARVDETDWKKQTPLMWAAAEGHADVVRSLLKAGADPDVKLKSGFTPLFFAVREGQADVVFALLEAGADINDTMQPERSGPKSPVKGTSPLVLAVENGHFELAAALLKAGADPNDQRSGYTALHTLTWVRKPNRGDSADGDPAPIGSGSLSSLDLVTRLVESGADVNLRLKKGRSGRGRLNQTGATAFLMAADTADVPFMKRLLELGADPQIPNADDCTPLLAAAGIGSLAPGEEAGTEEEALAAVSLLIEQGLDINAVDDNGETAMHGAAYKSLPRMAAFLASHGADINVWHRRNKYGWTPLLIAQGHRPGNFKPAPATIAAIETVMRASGVEPEAARPFAGGDEYRKKSAQPDR